MQLLNTLQTMYYTVIDLSIAVNEPVLKARHDTRGKSIKEVGITLNKGTRNKEEPSISFQ